MDPFRTTVPIYVSEKSVKNLWQDYRVYPDRVELHCWTVFSTFVIPSENIVQVDIRERGLLKSMSCLGLKLDLADLYTHVQLQRKTGLFKFLRFTPDSPERFVAACESIMRGNKH